MIPPIPTEPVSPKPIARPCSAAAVVTSAGGQAGLGPGRPGLGVDVETLHVAEVEHDPAVGRAVALRAVAAGPDREIQPGLARQGDDLLDVVDARDADDDGRAAIDMPRLDLALGVVVVVVGSDDLAGDAAAEPREIELGRAVGRVGAWG